MVKNLKNLTVLQRKAKIYIHHQCYIKYNLYEIEVKKNYTNIINVNKFYSIFNINIYIIQGDSQPDTYIKFFGT